ncbi:mannitol-1-phosphate 5-dehydrogenase [Enterococcus sp. DIV2402]|uniref:Mannitol-1-phosphate 5-dehydrogenase n=1 Tax=Candidatus Enterococcus lowellii TaxID=2230877 RepID=A0ABZ2SLM3_9ENTE|nr:mannitol-1-phosphate 5-dehydrogenase [Enterococcus sp. DIV2402]MBO0465645.1 mannitol-1-phosphate 5-dehydrogenase [Enterococcus sp. DIV2402]
MKAVHFGAGNIGRGFIGEILFNNGFSIDFVDINATIIDALKARNAYEIELASEAKERIAVTNVNGLNNQTEPEAVVDAIAEADIVTTAIGPNILPFIAELIAKGIQKRREAQKTTPVDVIACENMIGGSQFLFSKVKEYLTDEDLAYVEEFVGFPNAAVDRIVPIQHHEDPLFVSVEPFSEWVVDAKQRKNQELKLENVLYVEDLEPYIERKLFSVNTGHATTAYTGSFYGYQTIGEAIADERVLMQLKNVLQETGDLLIAKWGFDREAHEKYAEKIIHRFENPYISDDITRVARTPIRKLGFDERFIRPIREAKERDLSYQHLLEVVAMILNYRDAADQESEQLAQLLAEKPLREVIQSVTKLEDDALVEEIEKAYQKNK